MEPTLQWSVGNVTSISNLYDTKRQSTGIRQLDACIQKSGNTHEPVSWDRWMTEGSPGCRDWWAWWPRPGTKALPFWFTAEIANALVETESQGWRLLPDASLIPHTDAPEAEWSKQRVRILPVQKNPGYLSTGCSLTYLPSWRESLQCKPKTLVWYGEVLNNETLNYYVLKRKCLLRDTINHRDR